MIIVGLGNPGKEYENTRHNVGFAVLEKLAEQLHAAPWKEEFGVRWTKVGPHLLVQPMQFMNMTGATLNTFHQKKNVEFNVATDLFVVHDDVDFPLGEMHEQHDRSGAGHNGVQSIIDVYGQEFSRMRIGIGSNREKNMSAEVYVLQKFPKEEREIIDKAVDQAVEMLAKKISS